MHNYRIERNPSRRNVTPSCTLSWNGEERTLPPPLFVAFNKPVGYATTMPGNPLEPSVYEVFGHPNKNLRPVGRLDKDTSGLLLFTTHGRWALRMASPESNSPKLYRCWLASPSTEEDLQCFLAGRAQFKDTKNPAGFSVAKAALVASPVDGNMSCIDLCITEGKYHQVRLMWRGRGNHVEKLHRLSFGAIDIGNLAEGEFRELTNIEIAKIRLKMEIDS